MTDTLILHCLYPKCPNVRKVPRDPEDPPRAVHMSMLCPWHERSGDKESEVLYFDKNWKPISYEEIDRHIEKYIKSLH